MPLLILPAAGIALAVGFGLAWILRGRKANTGADADWKTRLAARDRDLYEARQEVADLTVALQEAQSVALQHDDSSERLHSDELAKRLRSAEAELADARNLEPDDIGTGSPDLLNRIEELEAELTTLASHRCPDPSVHASPGLMTSSRAKRANDVGSPEAAAVATVAPVGPVAPTDDATPDDLTRIDGIGVGLSKVLRSMGITSFEQLAAMDDQTIGRLDDLVGGVLERSKRHDWAGAARTLQSESNAAAL